MHVSLPTALLVFSASLPVLGCQSPLINVASGATAGHTSGSTANESSDWAELAAAKGVFRPAKTETSSRFQQTISIHTANLPLARIIDAVAQQLSVDWHSTEPLNASVTWQMPPQPAHLLLDHLANAFNFAWSLENGALRIQGPSAYTAFYPVDYLNLERGFQSRVGLATEVGTMRGVGEAVGNTAANSSSTTIENSSQQQFWKSLQKDLELWVGDGSAKWSINADTGLISAHATPNVHRRLSRYLKKLAATSHRQVLIEASVVEVLLSDEFEAGIDWQLLAQGINGVSALQKLHGLGPLTAQNADRVPRPSGLVTFSQSSKYGNFAATFQLLQQFGDARIVSRPQILAMNNQPAVLKVVDNRVYFTVNVESQQSADIAERSTQTQIHTVPVGLVMNVTPQISADNSVMLNVRPSLSRILGFVDDPNPDLAGANVSNGVPEIQVREMESVLRVPSGSVAVIGGLMQSVQDNQDRQLPGVSTLPVIGGLFGQQKRNKRRTELFIVIKPTVINNENQAELGKSLL